jgi:hypothetical protein
MDLNDLYKLAGIQTNDTPAIEPQPVEQEVTETPFDGRGDMKAMIALISPEQLNQLVGNAPVAEEMPGEATTEPNPQEYKGPLGSPADLSLRRYLGANGQPVKMENVYADHKVEDISEAWQAYKVDEGEMPAGLKAYHDKKKKKSGDKEETDESIEEASVNEEPNEGNEFSGELAKAKAAGKKDFKVGDKTYKVEASDMDRLRQLSGVNEAMQDEEVMAIMAKHPEEVAKMKQMGDMDTNSELYMELYRYYSDEMPIGTQKARDGDPVEYIMNALDDMGMLESKEDSLSDIESAEQEIDAEETMEDDMDDEDATAESEELSILRRNAGI